MFLPLREVETQELTSAASSVTFTSIDTKVPSGSRHLVVLVSGASDQATNYKDLQLQFNADTGSNYHDQGMKGDGSASSAAIRTSQAQLTPGFLPGSTAHASAMGGGTILIPHFAGTDGHKAVLAVFGAVEEGVLAVAGRWAATAAITSILIKPQTDNFLAGSRFVLCVVDERYLVAETILSGDATFSFPTLPAVTDARGDLAVVGYLRSDRSATGDGVLQEINLDTTDSHYSRQNLDGNATTATASVAADRKVALDPAVPGDDATAAVFGAFTTTIPNHNQVANDPEYQCLAGFHETSGPTSAVRLLGGHMNLATDAAVTRIDYRPVSGTNFKAGSMMSMYLVPRRLVQRVVLTGTASSVTFASLPTDVEALFVLIYARSDRSSTHDAVKAFFNGDETAANYDFQRLDGTSATVSATTQPANAEGPWITAASSTANEFGGGYIQIPTHDKTDRHKWWLSWMARAGNFVGLQSHRWESTDAITSIVLKPANGPNFIAASVFELWAIYSDGQDVSDRTRSTKTMSSS